MMNKVHDLSHYSSYSWAETEKLWLSKDLSVPDLLSLCNPYPDELMKSYRVSTDVNATVVNKAHNGIDAAAE